ncbi:DUF4861 family protein [Saccharicrinis sp. FJH62]|uniref:DUF4861 family protein n=1 Tax=Saccharicrinis sp. FJH62 TaxID=3344657 RepID=UPI0035D4723A
MKTTISGIFLMVFLGFVSAQNMTDISLSKKGSGKQVKEIVSETGDMYKLVEHHGPAIENEWIGLRLYFDYKCAIDVYNKTRPGLELEEAGWYPTPEQQKEGWGADQYKVGQTVGLGGVRLWDGEKEVFLNPVKDRIARVRKEANFSQMEMLSEGIPYKGDSVDILIRVTVFSGFREAKVEAFALCDKPVEFVTGINYFPTTKTIEGDNYICTWGLHPEDVAAFQLIIGGAIMYNPADFTTVTKADKQYMLISKPTKYLATWITSACEKEKGFKSMDQFVDYVKEKAQ